MVYSLHKYNDHKEAMKLLDIDENGLPKSEIINVHRNSINDHVESINYDIGGISVDINRVYRGEDSDVCLLTIRAIDGIHLNYMKNKLETLTGIK